MSLKCLPGSIWPRWAVALLLLGMVSGGCSPLLPLVAAALGGGADKPHLTGPFGNMPSSVQNSRPSDTAISDALAGVDDRIRPACQAKLPPPEPGPTRGCVLRPTCLPGSDQPMTLRLCAGTVQALPAEPDVVTDTDWRWSEALADNGF